MDPLVSIVTPVYNGEMYLEECIQSVLNQTYENWKYHIVNNRSTDRSLEIAQRYATRDERISVYNNEAFLSPMWNHNHALQQISTESKYCKIVQADDWLYPECIQRMVGLAEKYPSVGLVSSYQLNDVWVEGDGLPYDTVVVPGRDICRRWLLGGPFVFGSASSVLIRSDLVRTRPAFFKESHTYSEDAEAWLDVLRECDLGFVHQVLTYTRRHDEAMTSLARRYDIQYLARVYILRGYGPIYLTPEEYEQRLRHLMDEYYRMLAKRFYERRGSAYWSYHRKALENLGQPFRLSRLVPAAMVEGAGRLLRGVKRRLVDGG